MSLAASPSRSATSWPAVFPRLLGSLLCAMPLAGQAIPAPAPAAAPRMPFIFLPGDARQPDAPAFSAQLGGMLATLQRDRVALTKAEGDVAATVALRFVGAAAQPESDAPLPGKVHMMLGEQSTWRCNIPTTARARYRSLWPGVDLVVHADSGELQYDLQLAPGADVAQVALRVEGAELVTLEGDGSMLLRTPLGELRQQPPLTWEVRADGTREVVPSAFVVRDDGSYGFRVQRVDASRPLVVDPVLVWGTYTGIPPYPSTIPAVTVDAQGFVYLAGSTQINLPTTPGAFRTTNPGAGSANGFVIKMDPAQSGAAQIVWCTYLGGSLQDGLTSIALGPNGEVVTGGFTTSSFPTTVGALDTIKNASQSGIIAVLSANGASLLYGTLIEGTGGSFQVQRVAVEPDGKIVVGCWANGAGMPLSAGAHQTTPPSAGNPDVWFGRLDRSQTGTAQLLWGTYFGSGSGFGDENLVDLAISPTLPGIVTFTAESNNGASCPRDYTTGSLGLSDWLVGQFDMNASGAAQRRFVHAISGIGTNDVPGGVHVLPNGDILVAGDLAGARLVRLSASGAQILADRGLGSLSPGGIFVSPDGAVAVVGHTSAPNLTVTADAFQAIHGGGFDIYACRLDATLSQITYATYLGGAGHETDHVGSAHMAGDTLTLACATIGSTMPTISAYVSTRTMTNEVYLARINLPSGGTSPRDVELLDLDGDGDWDVATANETSDNVSLRTNNGQGVLAGEITVGLTAADMAPVALARLDLDNDGARDDLAVVCETSHTAVLLTDPAGTPLRVSLGIGGLRPSSVAAGDLDANPLDDVVVGRQGEPLAGGSGLALIRNGSAATSIAIPGGQPSQVVKVALGDLDGDGDLDLAALAQGSSDAILLFAGDGAGALTFAGALALSTAGLANGLCVADLDRDGDLDVAAVQPQLFPPAQTLRIYRRTASGALGIGLFTVVPDISTAGSFGLDLAAGDLEDDSIAGFLSRVDVALADAGSGTLRLLHGFTGSAFGSTSSPTVGTNPVAVAVGDLNADGCADVVVANQGSDDVTVVLTTPPALAQTYGTGCGGPTLSAVGMPTLGNAAFGVRVSNGRALAPTLLQFAAAPADVALPPSCRYLLAAPASQLLLFTSGTGQATLNLSVPNLNSLRGVDLFFQAAVFRSPGGAFADTLDLSDGLRTQLGQ